MVWQQVPVLVYEDVVASFHRDVLADHHNPVVALAVAPGALVGDVHSLLANPAQAQLYQEWIANDRRLTHLVHQMRQVAAKAAQCKLEQTATT